MNKNDKAKSNPGSSNDNMVQGFVFNLKGSEQVVMEGIKAFTTMMTQSGGGVLITPIARPVLPSAPTGKPKSTASAVIEQPETEQEAAAAVEDEAIEEPVSAATNGNGSGRSPRVPRTPNVLSDVDFTPALCHSRIS